MKIRNDFVTNSSSSSFIISKKILDKDQLEAIRNHTFLGKKLGFSCCDCPWYIDENDDYITGDTYMDNFSMYDFLETIEVDIQKVEWGESPFALEKYHPKETEVNENKKSDWRNLL